MIYVFGDYELDTGRYELRRAGVPCPIEPQVFDVLSYLLEHRDRVVTKDELLDRVWGDRFVSEATLSSRLAAARKAIGDSGQAQRYIRTVHGRGYRFVGQVEAREELTATLAQPASVGSATTLIHGSEAVPGPALPTTERIPENADRLPTTLAPSVEPVRIVGREADLAQLHRWLAKARGGTRQLVFVTGESGRGKTTLVEAFLRDIRSEPSVRIAHGQCVEHHGTGEAYLPVLEALGRLCRGPDGREIVALLAEHAPTWLVQMPSLVSSSELDALLRRVGGGSRDRMLREMVETLEALTVERPLVLVFEDLHWSDHSTLDLIARLARRTEPARLLVLGTYRPSDVRAGQHPLQAIQRDLRVHGQSNELALVLLEESAIAEYLAARFHANHFPSGLARLVHQRTDGNPLFVQTLLDSWVREGHLVERDGQWELRADLDDLAVGVPSSLRLLIEQQIERLPIDDQVLLEAASVAGAEFSAAAIAAAEDDVEMRCAVLARDGRFLRLGENREVEWPDGTVAAGFGFLHTMYQDVIYDRISPGRRARLHQRLGLRLEHAFESVDAKPAAELALHFTRGRDFRRAVHYHQLAAEQALRRSAHHEAMEHLTTAFDLLPRLPESPERMALELRLQVTLAPTLAATRGPAATEVEQAHQRALELCEQLDDGASLPLVLYGLAMVYETRGEYRATQDLLELYLRQESSGPVPEFSELLACSTFHQGAFDQAIDHAELGLSLPVLDLNAGQPTRYGEHLGVHYHDWVGLSLWYRGYPDQALHRVHEAVRLAREYPYSLCHAQWTLSTLHQHRHEPERARDWAEATFALANRQGFGVWAIEATILHGWALAALGDAETGRSRIEQGLSDYAAAGVTMDRPYYLALLADVLTRMGAPAEALAALDEAIALVRASRSYFFEAEIHRLRGVLLLQQRPRQHDEAEACWHEALAIARRQGARSMELRAAEDLSRLWQRQGKTDEARRLLGEIYRHFTEGFDTQDLVRARTLLAELGSA